MQRHAVESARSPAILSANQALERFASFISVKPQVHVVNHKEIQYVPHRKRFASIINTN